MNKKGNRDISITGSTEFTGIKLSSPKEFAAGIPAVKASIDHALKEMGVKRSIATLSKLNQIDGFDCPGCAWPDPKKRSRLGEFCENGVKAVAEEATLERVTPKFFAEHSIEEMSRWSDYKIGKSGRITDPMILRPGSSHYFPIKWEEAFELIAKELKNLENPDEAIFYTSGRSSNEAAFLFGLFARAFGTNNMPDCSNMCHESSGAGLGETLGIGKGSVTLEDIYEAEVVIVIGQNPGTNHPRMLSALEKCKRNGGEIVCINPLEEAGLVRFKNPQEVSGIIGNGKSLSDYHLQVKINQDVPLLKLIMKKLLELEEKGQTVFDHNFINEKTQGYKELIEDLKNQSDDDLLLRCGVALDKILNVVDLLANKNRIIICWAMGLTQHKNGVENIKECVNLLLLKGSIGKKGAGTCPVRGHSNVQGDRTVGIMHHVSPKLNSALKKVFNFEPPTLEGYDTVNAIKAMHDGKAKVFIALGGNFVSAASDTAYTSKALQNCNLTVSISTKLNRTHFVCGQTSIILPTLGRTELDSHNGKDQFLTVENSMGKVHRSHGRLTPASDNLKSEPQIVAQLAQTYFNGNSSIPWAEFSMNYDLIREKISQVFTGFENYTERSKELGFYLPNHSREGDFSKLPNGRAKFSVCSLPEHNLKPEELLLMTIRSHDQFNTTIYGLNDRYRGIHNERRVVFMNEKDIQDRNLKKLDIVDLVSNYASKERRAEKFLVIPYNIPIGNIAAYFPETNVLVPIDEYAHISNTPISKSIKVTIEKHTK